MAKQATKPVDLIALNGPPGPVLRPADCPGYGQELPTSWVCPICPIAERCYEKMLYNQKKAEEGDVDGR
jgi:rubredoxin